MEENFSMEAFIQAKGSDPAWLKRLSFTSIFVSSNMLQTMFTHTLHGLTSKQWMLLTIISSIDEPQTLSSIGKIMGCSRQNVKQITDILQKNGYVEYCKMEGDKNTVRIISTKKWKDFTEQYAEYNETILERIFGGFSNEELKSFFQSFCKLNKNIEAINNEFKS